jgi:hypothetical protein
MAISKEDNRPLGIGEGVKIGDVPYFVDGAVLLVASRTPKK